MFGNKLKKLRNSKQISQAELAGYFDVAQQTVGKWEKGLVYPNIETLKKMSVFFGVSIDYLLDNIHNDNCGEIDENEIQFLKCFRNLDTSNKQTIFKLMEFLNSQSSGRNNIIQNNNGNNNFLSVGGMGNHYINSPIVNP